MSQRSKHIVKKVNGHYRYYDEAVCETCGSTFLRRAESDTRFCSRACAGVGARKIERKMHEHVCAGCGKTFFTKKIGSKYCSRSCFGQTLIKDRNRVCPSCGITFRENRTGQKYCSHACAFAGKRNRIQVSCSHCGCDILITPSKKRYYKFCNRDCFTAWMRRTGGGRRWLLTNGGVSCQNGYVFLREGQRKYRAEHRIIMEEHLGRPLTSDEIVHHIDHDKTNNDISNLQIVTRAEHARLHKEELQAWRNS